MRLVGVAMWIGVAALGVPIAFEQASFAADPAQLLYERAIDGDEDTDVELFVGKGRLIVGGSGPSWQRTIEGYRVRSGAHRFTFDCPRAHIPDDDLEYCPTGITASSRYVVVASTHVVHVLRRNGEILRTIAEPLSPDALPFHPTGAVAIRGRTIAVAGELYDPATQKVSGVIFVLDGPTGTLLREHVVPSAPGSDALAFVGRTLVYGSPERIERDLSPGIVTAIDPLSGDVLWSRSAPVPAPRDRFGANLEALGSDVVVSGRQGAYRLDGRTGEIEDTYIEPVGGFAWSPDVAASRRWVAVASAPLVYVFSADTGAFAGLVGEPRQLCDLFAADVGISGSRLVVTSGTYCASAKAFVYEIGAAGGAAQAR